MRGVVLVLAAAVALVLVVVVHAQQLPQRARALVIDSDLGDDDVAAINLLFGAASSSASDCAPLGITTVFGVCSLVNATMYALGIEQAYVAPLVVPDDDYDDHLPDTMNHWPLVPISSGASTFLPGMCGCVRETVGEMILVWLTRILARIA